MFEEALAGGGENDTETVLTEVPLKTAATRQEEAEGQGQACLSLGCLCGAVPSCKPHGSPCHGFMLIVPILVAPRS